LKTLQAYCVSDGREVNFKFVKVAPYFLVFFYFLADISFIYKRNKEKLFMAGWLYATGLLSAGAVYSFNPEFLWGRTRLMRLLMLRFIF
jgi:asparagine N-glycosylation enzyme membrane subunit Stt3